MHEMSLMGDILDIVWQDASEKGISKIEKVELTVGELSQAMPDALRMAFTVFKQEYPEMFDKEAELIIEVEEANAACVICGHHYKPDRKITICPECGVPSGNLISGESFQVKSYEGS